MTKKQMLQIAYARLYFFCCKLFRPEAFDTMTLGAMFDFAGPYTPQIQKSISADWLEKFLNYCDIREHQILILHYPHASMSEEIERVLSLKN